MFHLYFFLFSIILFYILTPGILITIPHKSKKTVVALVHALIFATVLHFTHRIVWYSTEGFEPQPQESQEPPTPPDPSNPSLTLHANVKWSENHTNYEYFIPYILNNYPEITIFNINNNESADNAEIVLKDNNNPDGISFIINYEDKINVNEFEKFLNEKGYSKKKTASSVPESLS